jgi:hypothetical protein
MTVQICRASVHRHDGRSTQIALLLDAQGLVLPTETDLANLRSTSSSFGIVAGLQAAVGGKAVVRTLPEFDAASVDIALAAAVCAASWGWDESECIHVTVNGREWDVSAAFWDGVWTAAVA